MSKMYLNIRVSTGKMYPNNMLFTGAVTPRPSERSKWG
jgi:hypothetical protein